MLGAPTRHFAAEDTRSLAPGAAPDTAGLREEGLRSGLRGLRVR